MSADIPIGGTEEMAGMDVGAREDIFLVEALGAEGRAGGNVEDDEDEETSGLVVARGPGPITCC